MGLALLGAICLWPGCQQTSETHAQAPAPEPDRSFLNEPAGVPPDPLRPDQMEIRLRVAEPIDAVVKTATERFGAEALWPGSDATVGQFLTTHRAWYAPIDQLKRASTKPERALEPVAPILPIPVPALRIPISAPDKLARQDALALRSAGGRGNLVLWYPVMAMRQRFIDGGTTGMWRGVIRMRDELPGDGPKLGGTPVFLLAAIAAPDAALLAGKTPPGYHAMVTRSAWLGQGDTTERRRLVGALEDAPIPKEADLPTPWKRLFESPNGKPIAYLVPENTNAMDVAFQQAVEALVPLIRQGGEAWVLVALPLAQEHKPAIH